MKGQNAFEELSLWDLQCCVPIGGWCTEQKPNPMVPWRADTKGFWVVIFLFLGFTCVSESLYLRVVF